MEKTLGKLVVVNLILFCIPEWPQFSKFVVPSGRNVERRPHI
jgi:hypothetical protein